MPLMHYKVAIVCYTLKYKKVLELFEYNNREGTNIQ